MPDPWHLRTQCGDQPPTVFHTVTLPVGLSPERVAKAFEEHGKVTTISPGPSRSGQIVVKANQPMEEAIQATIGQLRSKKHV